jgi:hypothetical protein
LEEENGAEMDLDREDDEEDDEDEEELGEIEVDDVGEDEDEEEPSFWLSNRCRTRSNAD